MALYPCSVCGQRVRGRLCSVYHAWFLADGSRVAYRQRLCLQDFTAQQLELLKNVELNITDVVACPACGADSSKDTDPIYCTVYLPKQEPKEYALTTDAACAARIRVLLMRGAEKLPDRELTNGASGPASDWSGVLP